MLGDHQATLITGAMSPLIMQISWSNDPKAPLFLLGINKGRESLYVFDEHYYHMAAEVKFKMYMEKKVSVKELEEAYYGYATAIQNLYNQIITLDLSLTSEEELLRLLKQVETDYEALGHTLYIETLNYEMISKTLGEEKKALLDGIWEEATHPTFMSFEGRWLEQQLTLIKETDDLRNIVRSVKYIYTDYHWTKSEGEILDKLTELKTTIKEKEEELSTLKRNVGARKSSFESWKASLSEEETFLVDYIQMVMLFRDIRKDALGQAQAVIVEVAGEILKRAGVEEKHGRSLNVYECLQGVEYIKQLHNELIQRHESGSVQMTYLDGTTKVELCDFEKAAEEVHAKLSKPSHSEIKQIKGQIASKGKITGKVKIILDPHDEKGFVQGDILVTSMTRPEFVSIMKKSGAVITNEGGITCHAAIVSRELGIPCIIGTKVATRALKDGDMVEVDATTGIVTIL